MGPSPSTLSAEPDPHGQAALMLAESTLHTLIEVGSITLEDAIKIVATAVELKKDLAKGTGESRVTMERSLALLEMISTSLRTDLAPVAAI